jgi:hypothetical protein
MPFQRHALQGIPVFRGQSSPHLYIIPTKGESGLTGYRSAAFARMIRISSASKAASRSLDSTIDACPGIGDTPYRKLARALRTPRKKCELQGQDMTRLRRLTRMLAFMPVEVCTRLCNRSKRLQLV